MSCSQKSARGFMRRNSASRPTKAQDAPRNENQPGGVRGLLGFMTHFGCSFPRGSARVIFMAEKSYTVSDSELVLKLEVLLPEDGSGYGVTSPLEPQLISKNP